MNALMKLSLPKLCLPIKTQPTHQIQRMNKYQISVLQEQYITPITIAEKAKMGKSIKQAYLRFRRKKRNNYIRKFDSQRKKSYSYPHISLDTISNQKTQRLKINKKKSEVHRSLQLQKLQIDTRYINKDRHKLQANNISVSKARKINHAIYIEEIRLDLTKLKKKTQTGDTKNRQLESIIRCSNQFKIEAWQNKPSRQHDSGQNNIFNAL